MTKKSKHISIKNHTHYFFDDIINIKFFNAHNIKIDEKSCKNFLIYCIGYVTIKDSKYVKINCVNPLYFNTNKVNGYFEEINGNRYLTLVLLMKANKKLKNMENCRLKSEI